MFKSRKFRRQLRLKTELKNVWKRNHVTSRTWSNQKSLNVCVIELDFPCYKTVQTVQFSCSNLINSINWNVIEVPFRYLKCCMRWLLNSNLFIYLLPKADPSLLEGTHLPLTTHEITSKPINRAFCLIMHIFVYYGMAQTNMVCYGMLLQSAN